MTEWIKALTLGDVSAFVAFVASFITGFLYLKKHFRAWVEDWIRSAIKPDIDEIKQTLSDQNEDRKRDLADSARYKILRFYDELLHGTKHTQEHFEQILSDIKAYELYCDTTPGYKNHKADHAIKGIQSIYDKCVEEQSFL